MRILQGKRTLIFKEMLASFGHLDKKLVNDVARGFTITGDMPRTGVFEHRTESVAILDQGVDVLRSESFDSGFSSTFLSVMVFTGAFLNGLRAQSDVSVPKQPW